MDAGQVLTRLCELIDSHQWDGLAPLLTDDFNCRYVHTGETFDREGWVRVNAEYPGFDRLTIEDIVANGDRAVARCHVTGKTLTDRQHFEVATFVTTRDGQISTMTEVWTDVAQSAPAGTRPDQK